LVRTGADFVCGTTVLIRWRTDMVCGRTDMVWAQTDSIFQSGSPPDGLFR